MPTSIWEESLKPLQKLIMKPVLFNDLAITLVDALPARHDQDWTVDEHRHPWFEFNYVSDGGLCTTMDGCEFSTEAGFSLLVPPGVYHSNRHSNHRGDDGFCLRWQLEVAESGKNGQGSDAIAGRVIEALSIVRAGSFKCNAPELVESGAVISGILLQSHFATWILSLCELWNKDAEERASENDRVKVVVRQALLYLAEYYASDLGVKEVADSLHVSYRHLARIFKQVTGFTIIEKLNHIRINHAKKLLLETDKTIREIALEVGFNNEFYFSNIFNQYALITPSLFRKYQR